MKSYSRHDLIDAMAILKYLANCAKATIAGISLFSTFYTVIDLMVFLSYPNYKGRNVGRYESTWSLDLLVDMCLLVLFIFLHSFLAHQRIKGLFNKYKMNDIQRSVYVIITCAALQVLTNNWRQTHDLYIWNMHALTKVTQWVFIITHILSWLFIYIGCICMDVNELLGLKQIYYSMQKLPEPLACKSIELQRLYAHMRHPSFIAFLIVCWSVPTMSLDRFLLSFIMSAYMFLAWKTDDVDYHYQRVQFSRKFNTS